jgi:soluble lytic murein transglycosylase-like protein
LQITQVRCFKIILCLLAAVTSGLTPTSRAEANNARTVLVNVEKVSPELTRFVHRRTKALLPGPWRPRSAKIAVAVLEAAEALKLDPLFLMSIVMNESRFNPSAKGRHGEIGLAQVKPSTAKWLLERGEVTLLKNPESIDGSSLESIARVLKDPVANIAFGAAYLAHLKRVFPAAGQGLMFLTAYNMGAANLKSHLREGKQPRQYKDRIQRTYVVISTEFRLLQRHEQRSIASLASTFNRLW